MNQKKLVNMTADIAAAYYRLRKDLRKAGTLTKELDDNLSEQWWCDVCIYFGWESINQFYVERNYYGVPSTPESRKPEPLSLVFRW